MANVFITGSSDGLGRGAARLLIDEGHRVTLHARSEQKASGLRADLAGSAAVLVADVSTLGGIRDLARQANEAGRFDAVIHNVGMGDGGDKQVNQDGFTTMLTVNLLAPYLLTALMDRPDRLVYLSSGMHFDGSTDLTDVNWERRQWNGTQAYSDTKLFDATLAFAVARRWADVVSNAVDPGWVKTKMGGASAPEDIETGSSTQAWLAVSDDHDATEVTGGYFYKQQTLMSHEAADDERFQDALMDLCARSTGVELPS